VRDDLQRRGVVGDLCAHMFNLEGQFVDHEASRRTLSISVADLRRAHLVVAVAGGASKAESLLGAIRTGIRTSWLPISRRPNDY
jgi:DNA-binding transcriptional regulator LsrR (DeoR family)